MKFHLVAALSESAPAIFKSCMRSCMMSLNKLKPGRQADPTALKENTSSLIERPTTASNSEGLKETSGAGLKSFIPTYRSLSQPPSISIMSESSKNTIPDCGPSSVLSDDMRNSLLESEMFNDLNIMTDEFKDCLESVKLDLDTHSTTDFDTLNMGSETAEEILKNLKTPDEMETPPVSERLKRRAMSPRQRLPVAKASAPIKTLSRKNSNSGIPVSVSLSGKSAKMSPKPLQRRLASSPVPAPVPPPPSISSGVGCKRHLPSVSTTDKTPNSAIVVKRNLDLFSSKKKRYETMRKDIQSRQKPLVELYNALVLLKSKLCENGEHVNIDALPPFEADPPSKPKMQSVEVEVTVAMTNLDAKLLDSVKQSMEDMRLNSVELCRNMMEKRNSLINTFENIAKLDGNNGMLMHEVELHKNENAALDDFLSKTIDEQEKELKAMVAKLTHLKIITNPAQTQFDSAPDPTLAPAEPAEPREDFSKELQERMKELKERETKIKHLEKQLNHTQAELKNIHAANAAGQESGDALRCENDKLKQKIAALERMIDSEKKKAAHEVDRIKNSEGNSKTLKTKIKELETAKHQHEGKITQLSSDLRSAQNKLKIAEKNYEKELAELNKSRNLDKSVIERLNRDKSTFEARLEVTHQQAEEQRAANVEKESRLREEAVFARQECDVQTNTALQLRIECEKLRHELNAIHLHAQQSSELLRRKDDGKSSATERECELQIEVVAQRAAIKALQEKVDSNAMEKIRFIETIENMHGSTNEMRDDIVKTLVQKEEEITQMHQLLKKRDDDLGNRRIEVQNLKAKVENLQEHIQAMKEQDNDADLKHMIKEGRTKLEDALIKSLENERKLIQYEHEMAQKIQTVGHLENTLKLRDGLIGVLKSKKEELAMENKSLTKYSEQIRTFVIESKEELKEKSEIISQLQIALNEKMREINKFEKRMHQMEDQLALTNEKRYQLQDAVGLMQRELQMAKSAADADGETRYDERHHEHVHEHEHEHEHEREHEHEHEHTAVGRMQCGEGGGEMEMNEMPGECECECECSYDCECECPCECGEEEGDADCMHENGEGDGDYDEYNRAEALGLQPWQAASALLYNQYRNAYEQRRRQQQARPAVHSQSMGSITGRQGCGAPEEQSYEMRASSSGTFLLEDKQSALCMPLQVHMRAEHPSSCQQLHQCHANENFHHGGHLDGEQCGPCGPCGPCEHNAPHFYHEHEQQQCAPQFYNQPCPVPDNCLFGAGQNYQPVTFTRVDNYQVADTGQLLWLTPSATMQTNNAIITRDLFAHSCTKIKNHLENSLRRLNQTRASYT